MPRKFHKMPALPDAIDDPKVQELMSHYFATSNHDADHEGFADMFTADGEYSMNDRKAKGREEIINMRRGLWDEKGEPKFKKIHIIADSNKQVRVWRIDTSLQHLTRMRTRLVVAHQVVGPDLIKSNF
ncbi:MAG: hypothetical protein Q9199_006603 [Rusavskia elegans]